MLLYELAVEVGRNYIANATNVRIWPIAAIGGPDYLYLLTGAGAIDVRIFYRYKSVFMTHFQRGLLAAVLIVIGFFFWPLLAVGGFIAWSVYGDIRDEPEFPEYP